jgi:hypothetical protein
MHLRALLGLMVLVRSGNIRCQVRLQVFTGQKHHFAVQV